MKRSLLMLSIVIASRAMISPATSTDLRCDAVGVAQIIVPDLFAHNPGAQKLGLEATNVRLDGVMPDGACLVEVTTNDGQVFKYLFRVDNSGSATMDMLGVPKVPRMEINELPKPKDCSNIKPENRTLDCALQ